MLSKLRTPISRFKNFFVLGALVLGLFFGTMSSTPASAHLSKWRVRQFRFGTLDGNPAFSTWEIKLTIRDAARRFHPLGGAPMALCIADRESGFYPKADNPTSTAFGIFQIVDGTWQSWYDHFVKVRNYYHVGPDRGNPRNNIILGERAMHDSLLPWGGGCG